MMFKKQLLFVLLFLLTSVSYGFSGFPWGCNALIDTHCGLAVSFDSDVSFDWIREDSETDSDSEILLPGFGVIPSEKHVIITEIRELFNAPLTEVYEDKELKVVYLKIDGLNFTGYELLMSAIPKTFPRVQSAETVDLRSYVEDTELY